jgi:hypothetical protein
MHIVQPWPPLYYDVICILPEIAIALGTRDTKRYLMTSPA